MSIGQDITPGIVTDIESLPAVSFAGTADARSLIVGHGDIGDGNAELNTPYTLTRRSQVVELFGSETLMYEQVLDAFAENGAPIDAMVVEGAVYTDDLGDLGASSGTLQEVPVTEDPAEITFTADSEELETVVDYALSENVEVPAGEAHYNPTTGEFELPETPTEGSVEYTAYDYDSAFDALFDENISVIDYIAVVSENEGVVNSLEQTIEELKEYDDLLIGLVGAATYMDTNEYEAQFDNSRMQVFYPVRDRDGRSAMGAIAGMKSSLSLNGSIMNKRLTNFSRMIERINFNDKENLINEQVVPVESSSRGAILVDDPTQVSEENTEEANMNTGYSRFVIDRATELIHDVEEPYIGSLNNPNVRGSLQANIKDTLSNLESQDAILDYSVRVHRQDAMSAIAEIQIQTVQPLRNIYNEIGVGQ